MPPRSRTHPRRGRKGRRLRAARSADWVKVQAKGQVTIDRRARDELGIRTGDSVAWVRNRDGRWELWTEADFDRFWDDATADLADHLERTRQGLSGGLARSTGELAARDRSPRGAA